MERRPRRNRSESAHFRCQVFVDFSNYMNSIKKQEPHFSTNWERLGPELSKAAARTIDAGAVGVYQGLNVYATYDPDRMEQEQGFHNWATLTLPTFAGVRVWMTPRHPVLAPPKCPGCREFIYQCPECGGDMRGTREKGVDVRITTDIISQAWDGNYDIAILVTSDLDFLPLVEFLSARGIKVIHGAFPPSSSELTRECWGYIDVGDLRDEFRSAPRVRTTPTENWDRDRYRSTR